MNSSSKICVATRASPLALRQTQLFCETLKRAHPELEISTLEISTQGDRWLQGALTAYGGDKGWFVRELETALLQGRADCAVHSLKDLPHTLPKGLGIAAVSAREDPRDALIGAASLASLRPNARIGTASLRRRAQLLSQRADLRVEIVRGNIETRLAKLDSGDYDALVLAAAGLKRLNLEGRIGTLIDADHCLPGVGQGALAIETRDDDANAQLLAKSFADPIAERCASAERHCARLLNADCHSAMGAFANMTTDDAPLLRIRACVLDPDGQRRADAQALGEEPLELAERIVAELTEKGAPELLALRAA